MNQLRCDNMLSLAALEHSISMFEKEFDESPLNFKCHPAQHMVALQVLMMCPSIDENGFFKSRFLVELDESMQDNEWALYKGENELRSCPS